MQIVYLDCGGIAFTRQIYNLRGRLIVILINIRLDNSETEYIVMI